MIHNKLKINFQFRNNKTEWWSPKSKLVVPRCTARLLHLQLWFKILITVDFKLTW